jgi:hypothetical protein
MYIKRNLNKTKTHNLLFTDKCNGRCKIIDLYCNSNKSSRHLIACYKATQGLRSPTLLPCEFWTVFTHSAPLFVLRRCTILLWPWSMQFCDLYIRHGRVGTTLLLFLFHWATMYFMRRYHVHYVTVLSLLSATFQNSYRSFVFTPSESF